MLHAIDGIECDGQIVCTGGHRLFVIEVDSRRRADKRNGTIHCSRIELIELQSLGDEVGDGRFARSGGSVDCDNHDSFQEAFLSGWLVFCSV